MKDSPNEKLPQNITSSSKPGEVEDPLYSALIANIVINGCLCHATTILNILAIHALRKTSSLPKPLRTLLLSLTVSDLGIGLLGQPLEVLYLVEMLRWNIPSRATNTVSAIVIGTFYLSSLCSIMALSADRFIAIQMPLRYEDLVTGRRAVTVVLTLWLCSALVNTCCTLLPTPNAILLFAFFVVIESSLFLATTLFYYKIYLTIRRHKEQIQSQNRQLAENSSDEANTARSTKSAHSTFCICLLFWVCYLPHLFISIARQIHGENGTIRMLYMSSETLVLLNSSLNPVIYCWKMRHIRHTILNILRNVYRRFNG